MRCLLAAKSLFATANAHPLTNICFTAQSVGANVLNVQEKNLGLKPQGCASLSQPTEENNFIEAIELHRICSVAHFKNFNSSYYRLAMALPPLVTHNWL